MDYFLIFPSHLFPLQYLEKHKKKHFILIEGTDYFTKYKYHKKRLVFFIESMRNYHALLLEKGYRVSYVSLEKKHSFLEALDTFAIDFLHSFTIEERYLLSILEDYCKQKKIEHQVHPSPLFLQTKEDIQEYFSGKKRLRMQHFYEKMRKYHNILLDNGKPVQGKWSFDADNRKPLPKTQAVFPRKFPLPSSLHDTVVRLVDKEFSDNPGDTQNCWLPTTRKDALLWLEQFFSYFILFGPYEDAISSRDPFLFHSVLSPLLNIGLLTPKEVIHAALQQPGIPINSLEGFIRQIIGWREFVRGVDAVFGEKEEKSNFFSHQRRFTDSWYKGTTGIVLLDATIKKVLEWGYCHHIERLMILSNLMLLCEIEPQNVFVWFVELFVDSANWVMVPNVYGMGQFSDGGLFATKPYICGSNYLVKMSDYKRDDSCTIIDGLYWRFIDKKKAFLAKQPRLRMMVQFLEKMDPNRKKHLFFQAETFLNKYTTIKSI